GWVGSASVWVWGLFLCWCWLIPASSAASLLDLPKLWIPLLWVAPSSPVGLLSGRPSNCFSSSPASSAACFCVLLKTWVSLFLDKRKAVLTLLNDEQWSQWSA